MVYHMKRERNILAQLKPDWSSYLAKTPRGAWVHTDITIPWPVREKLLGWNTATIKAVTETMSVFTTTPLICKGEKCIIAHACPLIKHGVVSRALDKPCPVELHAAFRYLVGYVRDLGISPDDFTDLQMLNEVINIHIQINRCDALLQKQDPIDVLVSGVDQRTSLSHKHRSANPLVEIKRQLGQDLDRWYRRLVATREARLATSKTTKMTFARLVDELQEDSSRVEYMIEGQDENT